MTPARPKLSTLIKQNHFAISIFFCIVLAEIAPWLGAREGPLVPEITVKYLAVSIIFFGSGLTVKWRDLSNAAKQFRLHAFVQAFTFLFVPFFMQIFIFLIGFFIDLNKWIHQGLLIVGCMPPPVSSAVILIKSIGGNEAAAIFNSALGSILGIVLTPLLILIHVGISSTLPVMKIFIHLIQTMIIPIVLGQISQRFISKNILTYIPLSGEISLLFIIYSSFCEMFMQENYNVDAGVVLITVFLVVIIQMVLVFSIFKTSCYISGRNNSFSPQDVIAMTFCSTQKSLTLGLPLLKTLYSGYSHLSQISLPLLIYHPVQLILGGFLVPHCQKWLKKNVKSTSSFKRP